MTRVVFSNNYDMRLARAGWRNGTYPAHHLYGTAQLGPPFEIVDVPHITDDWMARVAGRLQGRLGDVGLQARTVVRVRRSSIVYAAQAAAVPMLGAMRSCGLFPSPIVGVFHAGELPGPTADHALEGFDHAIALSAHTSARLQARGMQADKITIASWGPDLDFEPFRVAGRPSSEAPLISTGKTGRDLETLLEAIGRTGVRARVYGRLAGANAAEHAPTATIVPPMPTPGVRGAPYNYFHTIADLQSAALVAIPLRDPYPMHGLTELADAVACGRPVIVTKAPYFGVDVEKIGCGWSVATGDVEGWVSAITTAFSDRDRLHSMGETGRSWAADHWNARLFSETVRATLLSCR
jgi:glycosyltransferase involved in cell wall biosynthesis